MTEIKPGWWFNEFQHPGVDFDEVDVVESYTQKQGTKAEDERALLARLGVEAHHTIIELGCGTGVFAIEAAQQCQQVYAVDISSTMLNHVQRSAQALGLENLTAIQGGFLSYTHQGAAVDFVVTKYALHHLPDFWKGMALKRLYQMLKPGGKLYLEDVIFSFDVERGEQAIPRWIDRVTKPEQASFSVDEFEMHVRDEYSTFDWVIEGLFERSGFDVQHRQIKGDTYASYIAVRT